MNNELTKYSKDIENRIFTIRGVQVMLDYHLAELYGVETKRINEQVKRNITRFPKSFMFQISELEWNSLQSQIATAYKERGLRSQIATAKRRTLPYVFTDQGVAMLSSVLNSKTAIQISIEIMRAFVAMRKFLNENASVFQRLDRIELKQLENDNKFEKLFTALESRQLIPTQGIFFDGQIFDAYEFASKLVRSARKSIILIDNYIDETTISILSKKGKNVKAILLTKSINKQLKTDIDKANKQYGNFSVKQFTKSHDRFLIIDNKEIYHLGASLKDLGRKWFAFSKMEKESVESILNSLSEI